MLGLVIVAILVAAFQPAPPPPRAGEGIAIAIEAAANAVAVILVIVSVSIFSIILAAIGLIRRERPLLAVAALCVAVPALLVVIFSIPKM